jgi:hypothetical protein
MLLRPFIHRISTGVDMYKDLEKKKIREREYGKIYRERKNAEAQSRQEEIKKKIAAAIVAAELSQQS